MTDQKKVLVTGSEGFVGKYVCEGLRSAGIDVVRFDLALGNDVFDPKHLSTALWEKGIDAVVHLVAHPHRHSVYTKWGKSKDSVDKREEFLEFVRLNSEGAKLVYDECDRARTRRLVYCSSGAVYGFEDGFGTPVGRIKTTDVPDLADDRLHSYPRSKLLAEQYLGLATEALSAIDNKVPEVVILRLNWIQHPTLGDGKSGPEWKGATCSIPRMVQGFVNAVDADVSGYVNPIVMDLIEKNDAWEGSLLASEILFGGE